MMNEQEYEIHTLKAEIKELKLEREEIKKAVKGLSLYLQVEAMYPIEQEDFERSK